MISKCIYPTRTMCCDQDLSISKHPVGNTLDITQIL